MSTPSLVVAGVISLVTGWFASAHMTPQLQAAPPTPVVPCGSCDPTVNINGTCGLEPNHLVNYGFSTIACVSDGICFPLAGSCKAQIGVRFSIPLGGISLRGSSGCINAPPPGQGWEARSSHDGGCGSGSSNQIQICTGTCNGPCGTELCSSTVSINCSTCIDVDV